MIWGEEGVRGKTRGCLYQMVNPGENLLSTSMCQISFGQCRVKYLVVSDCVPLVTILQRVVRVVSLVLCVTLKSCMSAVNSLKIKKSVTTLNCAVFVCSCL